MGGGSTEITPTFLTPPDVGTLRPDYANFLSSLLQSWGGQGGGGQGGQTASTPGTPGQIRGSLNFDKPGHGFYWDPGTPGTPGAQFGGQGAPIQGGTNPLYTPLNPLQSTALQQFSGLMTGQGQDANSPFGAAQRGFQQTIETGMPIDTSPITQQAQNFYSQQLAPSILDQYGARFGYRRGGALAEPLARAGADVSLGVSQQLLPYAEQARQRQQGAIQQGLGLPERGFQLGGQARQGEQDALQFLMQLIQGGVGGLSSQGSFAQPQFGPNTGAQNMQALGAVLSAIAAF